MQRFLTRRTLLCSSLSRGSVRRLSTNTQESLDGIKVQLKEHSNKLEVIEREVKSAGTLVAVSVGSVAGWFIGNVASKVLLIKK